MLVDSHCHLDFPDFAEELDAVVDRARQAGVRRMVTICTRVSQFDKVLAVAERFDDVVCTVGVHPHEAAVETDADTRRLVQIAKHPKVVGIGESGLDYFYEHSPRERQQASFRAHVAASRETGLPLVIHARDADDDMAAILGEEMGRGRFTGVLHCFSSSRQLADKAIDLGIYISLSGIVTFKKADELRETAKAVPLDRLLVETDAPYLAPIPMRGKRNEPAFVAHTAAKVAELRGMDLQAFHRQTGENFFRLFSRVPRPAA
ncbi:MAG: TatD family hydrolase [Alphaproteobacteria bacterium]|nr:TatD family hydrolase [Alphaproteobacteria bacterium]